MLRRLSQVVALVTVLAATVNAQCAVACSLLTMAAAPAGAVSYTAHATSGTNDHACCPHHRGQQTQPTPGSSCPQTVSHSNDARLEVSRLSFPAPMPAVADAVPELIAPRPLLSITLLPSVGSPGPGFSPLISALRI
jgi:hypothetical protein